MDDTSAPQVIETDADIRKGVRALRRKCAHMRRIHDQAGDPPLRRYAPGFEGLARIIIGQQLSIASAEAIWHRLSVTVRPMEPSLVSALTDQDLRAAGLSRAKVRTLRAVAKAVNDGLDLEGLAAEPEGTVHEILTRLNGIGPWTADIFLLFCAGRADAFASGDLALQIAVQNALGLSERPSREELNAIAERWRPWRGVAARILWKTYMLRPKCRIVSLDAGNTKVLAVKRRRSTASPNNRTRPSQS